MSRFIACLTAEVPPGGRKVLTLAGRSIGIFNVDGAYYALRNRCPHQGGPLCEGQISGLRRAAVPGSYGYTLPGQILRCPWHGWEFDIKTGKSWVDPDRLHVKRYPAQVGTMAAGSVHGPYQAETYPVSVAQACVIVEIAGSGPGTAGQIEAGPPKDRR